MAKTEIVALVIMCIAAYMAKRYNRKNTSYRRAVKRSYDAWKRSRKMRYY